MRGDEVSFLGHAIPSMQHSSTNAPLRSGFPRNPGTEGSFNGEAYSHGLSGPWPSCATGSEVWQNNEITGGRSLEMYRRAQWS